MGPSGAAERLAARCLTEGSCMLVVRVRVCSQERCGIALSLSKRWRGGGGEGRREKVGEGRAWKQGSELGSGRDAMARVDRLRNTRLDQAIRLLLRTARRPRVLGGFRADRRQETASRTARNGGRTAV